MRILAIDTALEACSASVFDSDDGAIVSQTLPMARGQAEALIPLVRDVVERSGGFSLIDRVATTVGPGSFTGLRVAISAARAFALSLRVPCVGISTLAAIAAPHIDENDGQHVAVAIDARHGHVYFELFSNRGRSIVEAGCIPLREAARVLGPATVKMAGPAAPLLFEEAKAAGTAGQIVDASPAPDIDWVARLGLLADPADSPPRPTYLKPADATPQQNGQIARQ
ncbi:MULTISPECIES: tRNA (adenosine(37)-N6)-threonylcarbamoyltransferase complex dimerization subunit type 1 TsaB [Labrys]|jgi:tRNA threonylcarbamoyl adenosine modification protein YeaZ|uniref:tRNA (adenosine(37)-N6)-threonylcarbamoyltransferase complex dimerization subunit type 1 TsaB n=1 Tax=Labrys TaxID=204476 RepID=UPI000833A518|nr:MULTISPECIES: tRNA (adenosine(37)-N6)-threonylcarbamoyltransferase complex dimerization subunit type 1 TsaB [unclassified Labrys (in: a-proteobacteria)]MDZ5450955.1 tRNA (adenosine(37)-N6)-threonylcarbamoyltransferase complex dimerization subunit type 1 TsaB [Labrys sp. ZIDIC5]OCC01030.1 tRNA N6-adenosine(37)-N6-threonylcarbamoyltransferase complex dimerization subunit TsaB [Labrys sp. WJW]